MLKDDEIKNRFQLTNQVLASLQENEQQQHQEKGENQTTVNKMWQGMKNASKRKCEETLGRERTQHKTFLSLDNEEDRSQKEGLEDAVHELQQNES